MQVRRTYYMPSELKANHKPRTVRAAVPVADPCIRCGAKKSADATYCGVCAKIVSFLR